LRPKFSLSKTTSSRGNGGRAFLAENRRAPSRCIPQESESAQALGEEKFRSKAPARKTAAAD